MIAAHVISLVDSTERRAEAARQLAHCNVEFEFFDALPGASGRACFDRVDDARFLVTTGRRILPGEIGCFASHRLLWQKCVERGAPMLILEDDFSLTESFCAALPNALHYLEQCGFLRMQYEERARKKQLQVRHGFALHYYRKPPMGATCYLLSPTVAAELVRASAVMSAPVDVFLKRVWQHRQPLYGLTPYTVVHARCASDSTIGTRHKAARHLGIRLARVLDKALDSVRRAAFNRHVGR